MTTIRDNFIAELRAHQSYDSAEAAGQQRFIEFVEQQSNCFSRDNHSGHVTASAWIVDTKQESILLTLHKKLKLWLQLGGHCDSGETPIEAALREAREESGLPAFKLLMPQPFNLDVHRIPAYGDEAEHFHYDVAYLLQAEDVSAELQRQPSESLDLQWIPTTSWNEQGVDVAVQRMYLKWLKFREGERHAII